MSFIISFPPPEKVRPVITYRNVLATARIFLAQAEWRNLTYSQRTWRIGDRQVDKLAVRAAVMFFLEGCINARTGTDFVTTVGAINGVVAAMKMILEGIAASERSP